MIVFVLGFISIQEQTTQAKVEKSDSHQYSLFLPDDTLLSKLVNGNNKLAFDIFSINYNNGNLIFSPLSIYSALAMTYSGAKNNTRSEMAAALNYPENNQGFNEAWKELITKLITTDPESKTKSLSIANAIWISNTMNLMNPYENIVRSFFLSEISRLDFLTQPQEAIKTINKWVEDKTNNKITDLLNKNSVNSGTRCILTNAVHFLDAWDVPFDSNYSKKDDPFYISLSIAVSTLFMVSATESYKYFENLDYQVVEIPYKNSGYSFVLFVPKSLNTAFTFGLKYEDYEEVIKKMMYTDVIITMPVFEMTSNFSLSETLKNLGVKEAFTDQADFSLITGKKDLSISDVLHKAYIKVNENGTEAAATTAVVMDITAIPHKAPVKIKADRPFTFFIKHNATNCILFMGKYHYPES